MSPAIAINLILILYEILLNLTVLEDVKDGRCVRLTTLPPSEPIV
jgi:hypothetical protein